ncbi:MAG: hypothetical protein IJD67_01355 [Clostridia bacterium]|nr:hypothetical protein [Clostridia bacterium]
MVNRFCVLAIIIAVVTVFFFACSDNDGNLNVVNIPDVGAFDLPQEMICIEENGNYYLEFRDSSKNQEVGTLAVGVTYKNDYLEKLSKALGKNAIYQKLLLSETLSNSAIVGKQKWSIDNEECEITFFDFYSTDKNIFFVVLNDSLDYDTVVEISKTFDMSK